MQNCSQTGFDVLLSAKNSRQMSECQPICASKTAQPHGELHITLRSIGFAETASRQR